MIVERLPRLGREIIEWENCSWIKKAWQGYQPVVAAEQRKPSLPEKAFPLIAIAAGLFAPATSRISRRILDGDIDDGPDPAIAFGKGLILDTASGVTLFTLYKHLPKQFSFTRRIVIMALAKLALNTATHFAVNIIEERIEAAKTRELK